MKKLMIGLVGALAIATSAEVESENIVGVSKEALSESANLNTTFFKGVASEGLDIQAIIPRSISEYGIASGDLTLKLLNSDLSDQIEYAYWSADDMGTEGWYDADGNGEWIEKTFEAGEGFILVNNIPAEDNGQVEMSGEVMLGKPTFELGESANLAGNITPINLDIQDIVPGLRIDKNGDVADTDLLASGDVTLKLLKGDLSDDVEYAYWSADDMGIAGWYDADGNGEWIEKIFKPGQGFILVNNLSEMFIQYPSVILTK